MASNEAFARRAWFETRVKNALLTMTSFSAAQKL